MPVFLPGGFMSFAHAGIGSDREAVIGGITDYPFHGSLLHWAGGEDFT